MPQIAIQVVITCVIFFSSNNNVQLAIRCTEIHVSSQPRILCESNNIGYARNILSLKNMKVTLTFLPDTELMVTQKTVTECFKDYKAFIQEGN